MAQYESEFTMAINPEYQLRISLILRKSLSLGTARPRASGPGSGRQTRQLCMPPHPHPRLLILILIPLLAIAITLFNYYPYFKSNQPMADTALDTALEAVRLASVLSASMQSEIVEKAAYLDKSDASPVTAADFGCQAIINHVLSSKYGPNVHIIGEEGSQALRDDSALRHLVVSRVSEVLRLKADAQVDPDEVCKWIDMAASREYSERFWTVDPIDGTAGFVNGRQFAVALALVEKGEVVVSVLGCPNLGKEVNMVTEAGTEAKAEGVIAWAVKGKGAWMRSLSHGGEFVGPAKRLDLREGQTSFSFATTRFCESVEPSHSDQSWSKGVAERLGIVQEPARVDSQVKYVMIAAGYAGVYLRLPKATYMEHIWDHAAGQLIVTEAGGQVSDAAGKPLDYTHGSDLKQNRGVIVTGLDAAGHAEVIDAIGFATH